MIKKLFCHFATELLGCDLRFLGKFYQILASLPNSHAWSFSLQQVHHHVPVRQLREQRLGGGGGVLGGLLQQRAEPAHLRVLQPGLPGGVQEDAGELLRGARPGPRPSPSAPEAGPRAQQRVLGAAREQSAESQRDDQRPHRGVHLSLEQWPLVQHWRPHVLSNSRGLFLRGLSLTADLRKSSVRSSKLSIRARYLIA
ncbi:hypothetical protein K0M31_018849 [Melipona bicolor]|uniref:Uncharacterized protein n=1 Tax=Melipona bicolor TaxID=60889 RepID=A0AA40KS32_9HYME|nr:hypothetical protein K0M31_018849 [Melipona bicolor]